MNESYINILLNKMSSNYILLRATFCGAMLRRASLSETRLREADLVLSRNMSKNLQDAPVK